MKKHLMKAGNNGHGTIVAHRTAELCVSILKWILCFLFLSLLVMNLIYFSNLKDNAENVEIYLRFPFLQLLYCAALLAAGYALYHSSVLGSLNRQKLEAALLIFVTVTSVFWIFMAYDVPKYDSYTIVNAAERFLSGDYSLLAEKSSYLQRYPFQLPFVLYVELLYKITGPGRYMLLRLLNVCYLVGIFKCLLRIGDFLLPGEKEKKMATLFLFGFWQPIFLSTFIYSLIPSMLCFLFAMCKLLAYTKEGAASVHKGDILLSGIFLGVSALLKSNAWINWIAVGIIAILVIMKGGKKRIAGVILISAVVALVGQCAINLYYEKKSGYAIESGTPKVLWLAMGLQMGNAAPGWYNGFPYATLESVGFDSQRAADIGVATLKETLMDFAARPAYMVKFFAKKELSQWCEPTYECLNSSYHREREKPMSPLTQSIYIGAAQKVLLFHLRSYQIISLLGALLYCLSIKRDSVKIEHLIIPLTILGGFLFHTFMEAKSSYVFPYYTMVLPFSCAGILSVFSALRGKGWPQKNDPWDNKTTLTAEGE